MPNKPYATNSKDSPYGAEKDLDRPTLWSQTSGNKKPSVSARTLRRAKARIAKKAAKEKAAAESSPEAAWSGDPAPGGLQHHGRRKMIWRDSTPSLRAHRRAAERAAKKAAKAKE